MREDQDEEEVWIDNQGGRLVRPFAMTKGRTTSNRPELDMFILVTAVPNRQLPRNLNPEYTQILALAQIPVSVAEISSRCGLSTVVVKVLVGDLLDDGYLVPGELAPARDPQLLNAVLAGLRRL